MNDDESDKVWGAASLQNLKQLKREINEALHDDDEHEERCRDAILPLLNFIIGQIEEGEPPAAVMAYAGDFMAKMVSCVAMSYPCCRSHQIAYATHACQELTQVVYTSMGVEATFYQMDSDSAEELSATDGMTKH